MGARVRIFFLFLQNKTGIDQFEMAKIEVVLAYLGHYKYPITIIVGILWVCLLSENSTIDLIKLNAQRNELRDEVEHRRAENDKAKKELDELRHNTSMIEKVARERYFMKCDDEDVFVLSTEIENEQN